MHLLLSYMLHGTPPALLLVPTLFAHLRRRGLPVLFLGVNTVEHLKLAEGLGATAVLSDRVHWLQGAMQEHHIRLQTIRQHHS
jgi:hypothetical protein